jgi:hypothetical protein
MIGNTLSFSPEVRVSNPIPNFLRTMKPNSNSHHRLSTWVWVWFQLQLSVDKGYFGEINSSANDVTGYLAALHELHNRVRAQAAQLTMG